MNKRNIWVSEELYKEIEHFQKYYNEHRKPKEPKINKLESTKKIAEYLKSKRLNKQKYLIYINWD